MNYKMVFLKASFKEHHTFVNNDFSSYSGLCGLLASEGGTIFRLEDGTCTVGKYRGYPGDYVDGEVLRHSGQSGHNVVKQSLLLISGTTEYSVYD